MCLSQSLPLRNWISDRWHLFIIINVVVLIVTVTEFLLSVQSHCQHHYYDTFLLFWDLDLGWLLLSTIYVEILKVLLMSKTEYRGFPHSYCISYLSLLVEISKEETSVIFFSSIKSVPNAYLFIHFFQIIFITFLFITTQFTFSSVASCPSLIIFYISSLYSFFIICPQIYPTPEWSWDMTMLFLCLRNGWLSRAWDTSPFPTQL